MAGASDDGSASCLTGDVIKVYVGPENRQYNIHEGLLTQYEWFRKKICYGVNQSASQGYILLRQEEPETFELLMTWLYRKSLKIIPVTEEKFLQEDVAHYLCLYFRACKWEVLDLQNALMDRLKVRLKSVNCCFLPAFVRIIYKRTDPQSPLRAYIVDRFIYKFVKPDEDVKIEDVKVEIPIDEHAILKHSCVFKAHWNAGNRDFMLDCYEALFRLCTKSNLRDPGHRTGCVYHRHGDGKKCRA